MVIVTTLVLVGFSCNFLSKGVSFHTFFWNSRSWYSLWLVNSFNLQSKLS